jgi:hypothetical protein
MGGYVASRAGLCAVEKRKISCPCQELKTGSLVIHPLDFIFICVSIIIYFSRQFILFVCFIEYLCVFLFYKIVKECNEVAGKARTLAVQLCNHHVQPNIKVRIIASNALILYTRVMKLYTAEGQHCTVGTYTWAS